MSAAAQPRILVADDQPDILEALRMLLKNEGYQTEAAKSPAAVLKAVEARDFALVLMDLNYARDTTSGQGGPRPPQPGSSPSTQACPSS
jgi:CheY-like chemotaxis protein